MYSHSSWLVIFVQPIAAECWRGRVGKLSRILGKKTQCLMNTLYFPSLNLQSPSLSSTERWMSDVRILMNVWLIILFHPGGLQIIVCAGEEEGGGLVSLANLYIIRYLFYPSMTVEIFSLVLPRTPFPPLFFTPDPFHPIFVCTDTFQIPHTPAYFHRLGKGRQAKIEKNIYMYIWKS